MDSAEFQIELSDAPLRQGHTRVSPKPIWCPDDRLDNQVVITGPNSFQVDKITVFFTGILHQVNRPYAWKDNHYATQGFLECGLYVHNPQRSYNLTGLQMRSAHAL